MTEHINTTAAVFVAAPFSPSGDFTVQAQIPQGSKARVDIKGRADANAPWVVLGTIRASTAPPMLRFAKCPLVCLDMSGNGDGKSIKAWSGE
ncbi:MULTISPECIES: hypothetical protein [Agrobacterium]|uniref:hypothetical protein n=1 Tax=Agrobacterium TaxID=357 RepID=UPI0009BA155F|nr:MULTISPECIES: hypothetical protein [Agrobacterium]QCL76038.1 hypothetical protein CFBP5499_21565 [Agrobacterium tumefaciens]CUX69371.1 hypothetical protein AGR6A_Lc90433 [Agrobacterium sp. NCPPB 925]